MRAKFFLSFAAMLLFACVLSAQTENQRAPVSAESAAFSAITDQYRITKQGGSNPTDADLKARREAGLEMAAKAKQFLKDYPASKNADDAGALWNIGLSVAALQGDDGAAAQLQGRVTEMIKDPKVPDELKLHAFAVNYLTQQGRKTGKHDLEDDSTDSQKAYIEAFFAAADVLSNKEDILKMLLLQAKSGRNLSADDKRSIAQRVLDRADASATIKAAAKEIISGEQAYAVGKPLDISFTAVDGRKINLADMKGKVVLIDFWATWCGPCVGEMPNVKSAYDKYHADGFEIIGISLDESKDRLLAFLKENDIKWPQYFDGKHWNNDISFRFGIDSVPTEWLIDKKGNLVDINARGHIEESVNALLHEK